MDAKRKILQDGVARPMIGGRWALMNKQEEGFTSFAYEYASLDAMVAEWDITIGKRGKDRFGEFRQVLRAGVTRCTVLLCSTPVDATVTCASCDRAYQRCTAHGGFEGAKRSLRSHRGLAHSVAR
jgi:hypothetical protein